LRNLPGVFLILGGLVQDEDAINFGLLGQMSKIECPECGALTSAYVENCEVCGAYLGLEEDPSLNFLAGGRKSRSDLQKIPMEESKNLEKVTNALAGLESGQLGFDDYCAQVEEVLTLVNSCLELYESPYMAHQLEKMSPEEVEVYQQMSEGAREMKSGLEAMLGDLDEARAPGLRKFEAGLWKVDKAQELSADRIVQLEQAAD